MWNYDHQDWVVSPESLLRRAVLSGLLTPEEAETDQFCFAAIEVCLSLQERYPEEVGSSDFSYLLQDFLHEAGVKAEFVNGGPLVRLS